VSDSSGTLPSDDQKHAASLGYKQELNRGWSGFSNFAISLTIICILSGYFSWTGVERRWTNRDLDWLAGDQPPRPPRWAVDGGTRLEVPDRGRHVPLGVQPGGVRWTRFTLFGNKAGLPVTFFAVTSITTIGLYIAYILLVFLRQRVGGKFEPDVWNLGKHYRWINPVAAEWLSSAWSSSASGRRSRPLRGRVVSVGAASVTRHMSPWFWPSGRQELVQRPGEDAGRSRRGNARGLGADTYELSTTRAQEETGSLGSTRKVDIWV
jgi:hypothetical protein